MRRIGRARASRFGEAGCLLAHASRLVYGFSGRSLLRALRARITNRERWTEKEQTQAEVEVLILDNVFESLPTPPFTAKEKELVAKRVYELVWQQSASGLFAQDQVVA